MLIFSKLAHRFTSKSTGRIFLLKVNKISSLSNIKVWDHFKRNITSSQTMKRGEIQRDLYPFASSRYKYEKEVRGKILYNICAFSHVRTKRNETKRDETRFRAKSRAYGRVRIMSVTTSCLSGKGRRRGRRESRTWKLHTPFVWLALKRPRTNNCSQLKASCTSMTRLHLVDYMEV